MKKLFTGLLLSVLMGASSAHAFDAAAVGAMQFTTPTVSASGVSATGYTGKASLGFGGIVAFRLVSLLADLEFGALYIPRKWNNPSLSGLTEASVNTIHVPILVRFVPLPIINFGAGLAYTTGTEDIAGLKKSGISMVGSVGARFPLAPTLSLLTDLRYQIGMTDQSDIAGLEVKFNDLQILAGINFGI